jgi:hypothetical protein
MDRVKFGLLGFGLEYALCGFECLVFKVLDFWTITWLVLVQNIRVKNQDL